MRIDVSFDVYSDTPPGRDPDTYSPTLRRFHKRLWSKPLPNGQALELRAEPGGPYLQQGAGAGAGLALSSDSIGHTYRHVKAMAAVIELVPTAELDTFFRTCSTIGAYTVFPSKKVDRRPTINGQRGLSAKIRDRFDLTLECIRRHYRGEDSPLAEVLNRYAAFFDLFVDYQGYVEFFLFQDLVDERSGSIRFWHPFEGFESKPLPTNLAEYRAYAKAVTAFVEARNERIAAWANENLGP